MSQAMQELLTILDLERLEHNLYRGSSHKVGWQRVFGGQVIGQALVAAQRTVGEGRFVHSLHCYFMLPGDPSVPIIYDVDRLRDGGSFTTRRVTAIQHGRAIFSLECSFQIEEEGLEHQMPMPLDVPQPEMLRSQFERDREGLAERHVRGYRADRIEIEGRGALGVQRRELRGIVLLDILPEVHREILEGGHRLPLALHFAGHSGVVVLQHAEHGEAVDPFDCVDQLHCLFLRTGRSPTAVLMDRPKLHAESYLDTNTIFKWYCCPYNRNSYSHDPRRGNGGG